MSFSMVVDSPPGMTRASIRSRSTVVRTSMGWVPQACSARQCSATSPWSARTPGRTGFRPTQLPPPRGQPLIHGNLPKIQAAHRLAEAARHLGEHLGVLEVGGGLDDGPRPGGRVPALEDARADE